MLFNDLLKLYEKGRRENSTPLEDFTTELLAGVLSNNNALLHSFVNDFLELEGEGFSVKTQKHYKNEKSIIDMVFENENTTCFIENKVHSWEGAYQLPKYSGILDNLKAVGRTTKLCYCTKFYDPKGGLGHDFKQFRWFEIYNFMQKSVYKTDNLVQLFVQFLAHNHMDRDTNFNDDNIFAISCIGDTLYKMDNILEIVDKDFLAAFGKNNTHVKRDDRYQQLISKHNRFVIYKINVLSNTSNAYSDICMGFSMADTSLVFTFYVQDDGTNFNAIKEHFEKYNPKSSTGWNGKNAITVFFAQQKMAELKSEKEIIDWFKSIIRQFKECTDELARKKAGINWLFN